MWRPPVYGYGYGYGGGFSLFPTFVSPVFGFGGGSCQLIIGTPTPVRPESRYCKAFPSSHRDFRHAAFERRDTSAEETELSPARASLRIRTDGLTRLGGRQQAPC